MQSKRSEEARSSEGSGEVFRVWKRETQEVRMSQEEGKEQ